MTGNEIRSLEDNNDRFARARSVERCSIET